MVRTLTTKASFDETLRRSHELIVVDFTATWCGPCQAIAPEFERMAKEYEPCAKFFKVDVDENEETAEMCKITAMPTFQLFLGGKRVGKIQGADMKKLRSAVAANAPAAVDKVTTEPTKKKQRISEAPPVDRAEKAAEALLKAQEQLAAKAAAKAVRRKAKLTKALDAAAATDHAGEDDDVDAAETAASATPLSEAELAAACKAAKEAARLDPCNEGLAKAYQTAKAAYAAYCNAKPKAAAKQPCLLEMPSDCVSWTCEICSLTLAVRADGRAKDQHLSGKLHCKRVAQQQQQQQQQAQQAPSAASKGLFVCHVCACTGAASAEATHMAGAKHIAKMQAVQQVVSSGRMQKGDWICVRHGLRVQHNFASKHQCKRSDCGGTREEGLSYERVMKLASPTGGVTASKHTGRGEGGGAKGGQGDDGGKDVIKAVVSARESDVELSCRDCTVAFAFTVKEQAFYEGKGYALPSRCLGCRSQKRKRLAEAQDVE